MNLIHAENSDTGAHELSARIIAALSEGKKTLWLICGGSNITTAVNVMNAIRESVPIGSLENLTVSQSDERYGPVGHADSNWEQLEGAGFKFDNIAVIPILRGLPLAETVSLFGTEIMQAFQEAEVCIALLGIGPDGHIAGMLPHSEAVHDHDPVSGYVEKKFTRVTLTPPMLLRISAAFVFAFGEPKAQAMHNLRDTELSLEEEPAQILKKLPEAYVYSDQI
jgi:6-phosphogluconolactonase/glucosamine-6-phosphate isomerase/deaminase